MTAVNQQNIGQPPTGSYSVSIEQDASLAAYTIYRPAVSADVKLPVVAWGNGACAANGTAFAEFLTELSSHGYLIIASGAPGGSGSDAQDGSALIRALDWAIDENSRACSLYHNRLDIEHVAYMGQSCGGLMALNAAHDTRITTAVAWNSGLLNQDENVYAALHTPIAYFNGGSGDIAYPNGNRDFAAITSVPVYMGNLAVGHGGTYAQDNGGEFAKVGLAWLNWFLKGDESASGRGMLLGDNCGICNSDWVIEHKNFD